MGLIEQTIEYLAVPVDPPHEPCPEGGDEPFHGLDRQPIAATLFDPCDRSSRQVRVPCQVFLPPASLDPKLTHRSTESDRVDPRRINDGAYQAIDRRFPDAS
jgi:hypothetical protein